MTKKVEIKAIKKSVSGLYFVRAHRAAYKCKSVNFIEGNTAELEIIEAIGADEYYSVTAYEVKL
jgi:hypothetical protein